MMSKGRQTSPGGDTYRRDLRKIWGGAKNLGMDEDTLRDLVEDLSGARSISGLNRSQRWELIKDLEAKGAYQYRVRTRSGYSQKERTGRGSGLSLVTNKQQRYIDDLWERLGKHEPDAASKKWQRAFVHRIINKAWPQKVWEGQQVIEALKKRILQMEHKDTKAQRHEGRD